jgi:hypothetical protein
MVKNLLQVTSTAKGITTLKFIYLTLHKFNQSKPICEVNDVLVQWDECDLSNLPPLIEPGTASMISHGKFSKYNEEDLPTTFMDTDGNEHLIADITMYKSSKRY